MNLYYCKGPFPGIVLFFDAMVENQKPSRFAGRAFVI
jgi:hypothetical protein